jgi:hypothetical protein
MRQKLPNRRAIFTFTVGEGMQKVYVSVGEYRDGKPGELWLESNKEGTWTRDILHALALSISLGLQHGVTWEQFAHTYRHLEMESDTVREIFRRIGEEYGAPTVSRSAAINRTTAGLGPARQQEDTGI